MSSLLHYLRLPPQETPSILQLLLNSPTACQFSNYSSVLTPLQSNTAQKSKLLYNWWFTANQFCLSVNPLQTHDQSFLSQLNPYRISPYVTASLTTCVCQGTYCTYIMLLKILPFALYTSPLSVKNLQSISCLSYVSYATMAV
jgi:hypothetical protein